MTHTDVRVCGSTRVIDASGRVLKIAGVKPRRILEMLAVSQGTALSKDVIADRLWDGEPPRSYLATLESHISNLRRAMGGHGRDAAVQTTSQGYVLQTTDVTVDVVEARRLFAAAGASYGARRADLVERALVWSAGPLLADDRYSLWAEEARLELEREVVESCTHAARAALDEGDHATAVRLARHAVHRDEVAEAAWQTLVKALAADGRSGEALAAFAQLRAAMRKNLGVEPSHASRELYTRLLAGSGRRDVRGDREELSALVTLLRQRLQRWPGIEVPTQDEQLLVVATRILSVA